MGLDITAYRQIRRIADWPEGAESIDDVADYGDDGYVFNGRPVFAVYPDATQGFPEHAADLAPGLYTYAEQTSFRAGSYSGYNAWRDALSRAALGLPAKQVWSDFDRHRHRERGVAWLINADIRAHESAIRDRGGVIVSWFGDGLDRWIAGLALAADDGVLSFH
jgi:hypothetical protein